MKPDTGWQVAASAALGSEIIQKSSLGGGDFATSSRALLADGRQVFLKTHRQPPPGFFSTEAAGLGWLFDAVSAATSDVGSANDPQAARGIRVPEVLAVADEPPFLALEWIEAGVSAGADEEAFGRALAQLHQRGFSHYGRPDRCTTGSLAMPNEPCAHWRDFYATQRLLPLARVAAERGSLPPDTLRALESLAARLDMLGVPDEAPALLHGDLWAGNRVVDSVGQSWLIDPAAHGGHREFDLAMMRLFGGFSARCFSAYDECWPLAAGWPQRVELHQLAPLVVHAIKFGGHYVRATQSALERYA